MKPPVCCLVACCPFLKSQNGRVEWDSDHPDQPGILWVGTRGPRKRPYPRSGLSLLLHTASPSKCSPHSNGPGTQPASASPGQPATLNSLLGATQSPVLFQGLGAEAIRGKQVWASELHREQRRVRGHSLARLRWAVQTWPRAMLRGVSSLRTKGQSLD